MKRLNKMFKTQSNLHKMTNGFCQVGLETVFLGLRRNFAWVVCILLLEVTLEALCVWGGHILCQQIESSYL